MPQTIDLKQLERRTFRSTFQDGLLDMFVGFVLLDFALIPLLEPLGDFWGSVAFLPVYLLGWLGYSAGKKYATAPRMGAIRPGPDRKAKLSRIQLVIAFALGAFAVLGLAVIALQQANVRLADWLFPGLIGLLALAGFIVGAYFLDLPRLYGYGALVGLAVPIGELLYRYAGATHHGWPIAFGVSGMVIFIAGAIMLARFLRAYPVVREGGQ
jgi:hypothetical protein